MAIFLQYRRLKQSVVQQLQTQDEEETSSQRTRSRLSLSSTIGPNKQFYLSPSEEKISTSSMTSSLCYSRYSTLDGITIQYDSGGREYYLVGWDSTDDPLNPRNWPTWRRLSMTVLLFLIAYVAVIAIGIDAAVAPQATEYFQTSEMVESFSSVGIFSIGLGVGCLFTAPVSEILGRYPAYACTLFVYGCWILGAALSKNLTERIIFRFLAGLFGSAPLTVPGGSISDMWTGEEKTWTFPLYGTLTFASTVFGPVVGSHVGMSTLSWRWVEWIVFISTVGVLCIVLITMRETFAPQLLKYKAKQFRKITNDQRFLSPAEVTHQHTKTKLQKAFCRPFQFALDPIIVCVTVYTSVVYIVLFTSFCGYPRIFGVIYGLNQSQMNLCYAGLVIGILLSLGMVPLSHIYNNNSHKREGAHKQERRLFYAMFGAPLMPLGLFWMAWTDYASISMWSPLCASVLVGFGAVCIWLSTSLYVIDTFEVYAASALTFVSLVRYLASGIMTVVGVPMYRILGAHWTLSLLGILSAVITPIPYVFYAKGDIIRARSKYIPQAENK